MAPNICGVKNNAVYHESVTHIRHNIMKMNMSKNVLKRDLSYKWLGDNSSIANSVVRYLIQVYRHWCDVMQKAALGCSTAIEDFLQWCCDKISKSHWICDKILKGWQYFYRLVKKCLTMLFDGITYPARYMFGTSDMSYNERVIVKQEKYLLAQMVKYQAAERNQKPSHVLAENIHKQIAVRNAASVAYYSELKDNNIKNGTNKTSDILRILTFKTLEVYATYQYRVREAEKELKESKTDASKKNIKQLLQEYQLDQEKKWGIVLPDFSKKDSGLYHKHEDKEKLEDKDSISFAVDGDNINLTKESSEAIREAAINLSAFGSDKMAGILDDLVPHLFDLQTIAATVRDISGVSGQTVEAISVLLSGHTNALGIRTTKFDRKLVLDEVKAFFPHIYTTEPVRENAVDELVSIFEYEEDNQKFLDMYYEGSRYTAGVLDSSSFQLTTQVAGQQIHEFVMESEETVPGVLK